LFVCKYCTAFAFCSWYLSIFTAVNLTGFHLRFAGWVAFGLPILCFSPIPCFRPFSSDLSHFTPLCMYLYLWQVDRFVRWHTTSYSGQICSFLYILHPNKSTKIKTLQHIVLLCVMIYFMCVCKISGWIFAHVKSISVICTVAAFVEWLVCVRGCKPSV
jgi:hypothetical protein